MITQETVLILGAGASMAYGFPSGQKLKALIWQKLANYRDEIPIAMGANIQSRVPKEQFGRSVEEFRNDLLLSPDYSIDSFLEHHSDKYRKLGKICIAEVLLPLERRQYLFDDWMLTLTEENFSSIIRPKDGHWYQYLFNQMCKDCKKFEDFSNNKMSIVTFNYDRSLEYYLLACLHAKYKKDIPMCAKVLKNIPILHVYGKLGELPELSSDPKAIIPYDNLDNYFLTKYLQTAENSIKIIHDPNTNTSPEFQKAQELIKKAKRIYFLGFGYLEENMKRLFTDYSASSVIEFGLLKEVKDRCCGTTLGISPHQEYRLRIKGLDRLQMSGRPTYFQDATIYDFLFYNAYARFD